MLGLFVALFVMVFVVGFIIVALSAAPAIPGLILALLGRKKEEKPVRPRLRVLSVTTVSAPVDGIGSCTYCGSLIEEGSLFCSGCGARV